MGSWKWGIGENLGKVWDGKLEMNWGWGIGDGELEAENLGWELGMENWK